MNVILSPRSIFNNLSATEGGQEQNQQNQNLQQAINDLKRSVQLTKEQSASLFSGTRNLSQRIFKVGQIYAASFLKKASQMLQEIKNEDDKNGVIEYFEAMKISHSLGKKTDFMGISQMISYFFINVLPLMEKEKKVSNIDMAMSQFIKNQLGLTQYNNMNEYYSISFLLLFVKNINKALGDFLITKIIDITLKIIEIFIVEINNNMYALAPLAFMGIFILYIMFPDVIKLLSTICAIFVLMIVIPVYSFISYLMIMLPIQSSKIEQKGENPEHSLINSIPQILPPVSILAVFVGLSGNNPLKYLIFAIGMLYSYMFLLVLYFVEKISENKTLEEKYNLAKKISSIILYTACTIGIITNIVLLISAIIIIVLTYLLGLFIKNQFKSAEQQTETPATQTETPATQATETPVTETQVLEEQPTEQVAQQN